MERNRLLFSFTFIVLPGFVSSFIPLKLLTSRKEASSALQDPVVSKCTSSPFLHASEYPSDDYSHIFGYGNASHSPSKLQEISAYKIQEVIRCKRAIDALGCGIDSSFYVSEEDLQQEIVDFDNNHGPPLSLLQKLKASTHMAVAAEFKRASPSKGVLNSELDAATQCLRYAKAGATLLSVLTEQKYFRGTLQDMKKVRVAVSQAFAEQSRPLVLRKDFVFDRYQVLEARANGADTLLLIVAVLGKAQLRDLIEYSRGYRMEPLVEVNNVEELEIALACGARVIGVNNRNLHSFQLDLQTTAQIVSHLQARGLGDIEVLALSGISSAEEVERYREMGGVRGCLVGETLMKAPDPALKIQELFFSSTASSQRLLVKVCGLTSSGDASLALQEGAGLGGLIFAPRSKRSMLGRLQDCKEIVQRVRSYGERTDRIASLSKESLGEMWREMEKNGGSGREGALEWYRQTMQKLLVTTLRRPLVVGVFQNQSPEEINRIASEVGLDLIQLHGDEDTALASQLSLPCIKVLHVKDAPDPLHLLQAAELWAGKAVALLVDAQVAGASYSGGAGKVFDWSALEREEIGGLSLLLAGGLNANNVGAIRGLEVVKGVDVSSGVETDAEEGRRKDPQKVKDFFSAVRSVRSNVSGL